jgi:tripartite-type tricarboxylate transporter receptor subunit TctC
VIYDSGLLRMWKSGMLLGVCGVLFGLNAFGQPGGAPRGFPMKPVRLVVPFAPAGAGDLFARSVAQRLKEALGQEVVVENRGGAGGTIGLAYVARSAPDGYTLGLGNLGTLAINPALYKDMPYDSTKSFDPISLVGGTPLLLVVHPSVPARTAKELFALAKAQPGKLNYASAGSGGPTHLTMEIIKSQLGVNIVHVPYKGNVAAITSLVTGETHMMITTILTPLPHMQNGRLRGLAVTTANRQPAVPDIPTLAEGGMRGFDVSGWYGILAPAGTPRDIVVKLNAVIVQMMGSSDVTEQFTKQGLEVFASTPDQFMAKIRSEMVKWGKVVRDTGATVD